MQTSCTWWDTARGGTLELDEPEVQLELEVIGGVERWTWIDSESEEVLGMAEVGEG